MKFTRIVPRFRSFKFAPVAVFALFLFTNLTGVFFNRVFAPAEVQAATFDANYIPADIPSSGRHDLDLIILHAGERHGVDPRLIHAVIWQESKYKVEAKSGKNAQGLMQLIPATARRWGCTDANDMTSNVEAGTQYLRWLLKRFKGDVTLALAGYNAGEGSVDKYAGVPPYNETQNYVRIITSRYGKTFHPLLAPEQARVEFHLTPELARNISVN
ncbi:MAG: lytic transglycosylase domain-containing protein [Pyrinomonadaceae bacterium]